MEVYFGTKLINHIFIILTLIKRQYSYGVYAWDKEKKGLKLVILLPTYTYSLYVIYFVD